MVKAISHREEPYMRRMSQKYSAGCSRECHKNTVREACDIHRVDDLVGGEVGGGGGGVGGEDNGDLGGRGGVWGLGFWVLGFGFGV